MSDVLTPEETKELWNKLKELVDGLEKDLEKSLEKGNAAAGRRVRAELRDVKKLSTDLIRAMVALQKSRKE